MDERKGQPIIVEEWLQWRRSSQGKPFRFLDVREGKGRAVSGEFPDEGDNRDNNVTLNSPDLVAVNALGQFSEHPRVAALRDFITGWYVSYFTVDEARTQPEAGPQEHLSRTGDNLANVIQYLQEHDEDRLNLIFEILRRRVPRIEKVLSEQMPDGRLLLQIKDAPFANAMRASDIAGIPQFIESGASLGNLWMEGRFGMGDPLVNQGAPRSLAKGRG